MARRKAFYQRDYGKHVGAVAMCIVSFVAFALATCGTPLGMLMIRNWTPGRPGPGADQVSHPCYTLWGKHNNCWNANYSARISDPPISQCPDIRIRFEAAEAFSVMAIFALLFLFGAAWYRICDADNRTLVILISVFAIGCVTVPWAVVTAFYYTPFCGLYFLTKQETTFGDGYILLIVSFAVQIVGLFLFVILEPVTVAKKSADDKDVLDDISSNEPSSH